MNTGFRQGYTDVREIKEAVQELHRLVAQPQMELVVFFCSRDYDPESLAVELRDAFRGVQVVGCTAAGEFGPGGYQERGISGFSLSGEVCDAVAGHFENLQQFEIGECQDTVQHLLQQLEHKAPRANDHNSFALLLIDGLSQREEKVARTVQEVLGNVPLAGGSAGDGLRFAKTLVFSEGTFRSDRAVLVLVTTPLPFMVFKTQHFESTDQRLVITEADTEHRLVREINGLPADQEYSRLLGIRGQELTPDRFAASPVVVLIDGSNYVRSIQKVNADGSITFYCAIEEGIVLRIAKGVDLLENLKGAFSKIRAQIGPPQLVIGCDCILRRLEVVQKGIEDEVAQIFRNNNAVGFSTYGEQFRGMHVNQTLTGIAIGSLSDEAPNG